MAAIIPRWEWRTFGAGLRAAEDAFAALTPGPVEESDEVVAAVATRTGLTVEVIPGEAVPYTERFGLAGSDLSRLDGRPPPDALVGMGGAVTNIMAVQLGLASYDPDAVQGAVLDRVELDRQIERYRARGAEARRAIVGLQPKRAEVILAGACIVRTVMEKLGQQTLTVSDRGLRHGLLVDRFDG
jgi:exopolyphosphatase/pppGpp-phosphohydrolase